LDLSATANRLALRELHAARGAVFEEELGFCVPAFYGPLSKEAIQGEYVAATQDAAIVDLSDRGILVVRGPDRQKFLNNILSNDILGRAPGSGCLASMMTIKGHILALMRVLVGADAVLLEMPLSCLKTVEEGLLRYRVAAPVRFSSASSAVFGFLGPRASERLQELGLPAPSGDEDHALGQIDGAEVLVARASDIPRAGYALHVQEEAAGRAFEALSTKARPLGRRTLDALRVEEGKPWYGSDVTEDNLLHETGLVGKYHSPAKGCYVGQEVIARLEARGGNVNKLIRGIRLSTEAKRGSSLLSESKEVGRVTTGAFSPRLGPIALAYVHRSHCAPGQTLEVEGAPATIVNLPFPS